MLFPEHPVIQESTGLVTIIGETIVSEPPFGIGLKVSKVNLYVASLLPTPVGESIYPEADVNRFGLVMVSSIPSVI